MPAYSLAPAAARDLREIKAYTLAAWGDGQAEHYLTLLAARFAQLAEHPSLGRRREALAPGLRSFRAGQHIAYYRERDGHVEIARVLHPSMDAGESFGA